MESYLFLKIFRQQLFLVFGQELRPGSPLGSNALAPRSVFF